MEKITFVFVTSTQITLVTFGSARKATMLRVFREITSLIYDGEGLRRKWPVMSVLLKYHLVGLGVGVTV